MLKLLPVAVYGHHGNNKPVPAFLTDSQLNERQTETDWKNKPQTNSPSAKSERKDSWTKTNKLWFAEKICFILIIF